MTYSYLISIPLIMTYAIGFAIIKYQEGFLFIGGGGAFPVPYTLWTETNKKAIFPMYLLFSTAWSFEMYVHV